jgi:CHAT domain-containing protein
MRDTPRARDAKNPPPSLPSVDNEGDVVTKAASSRLSIRNLAQPSAGQVLGDLKDCCIAHLACHGKTDSKDPSSSHLILQKGGQNGTDKEQDLLTVHLLSKLQPGAARLAYLSVCSTARNSAERLSDEVIHVVSGFQLAGFPHVVGCLWPADDWACVNVAKDFYTALLGRAMWWEGGNVGEVMRGAVMKLRAQQIDRPLIWAPFVHYGI